MSHGGPVPVQQSPKKRRQRKRRLGQVGLLFGNAVASADG